MIKHFYLLMICLGLTGLCTNKLFAQEYVMLEIRNCQQEMRTVTFQSQVRFFEKCAYGMSDLRKQRILFFSPKYPMDTVYLQKQIDKIRRAVPAGFFNINLTENWYDNVPDEPALWFTEVFVKRDKDGNITAYAAYRVTFEGNNAHEEQQRMNPKITNIEFIFDKAALAQLAQQLKKLPESNLAPITNS